MGNEISGNRQYNDTVFRLLFANESKSAELYNAVNGTSYTANEITMNTLQSPLFYGTMRNDLSFIIEDKFICMTEHQSSVNPNMPFRFLLYMARVYEQLVEKGSVYRAKPISIPTPEFYVMYNGIANYPDKTVLKLSDLFRAKDTGEINLELAVTVYNINSGHSKDILERSETLDGYAAFIAKVRGYKAIGYELTDALEQSVKDCINENILREFLNTHGGEVVSLFNMEWNMDDAKRIWAEEAKEDAQEEMAKEMLLAKEPINKIVKYTKLTEEKILALKKKLKI